MTLATADERGTPWASPVWFATDDAHEFFWVSSPESRHSRNLAVRSDLAIVIFDSIVEVGSAEALYLTARASQLEGAAAERGLGVFNRVSRAQGLREWAMDDVIAPARHRLYAATVLERFVLGPRDERLPVG